MNIAHDKRLHFGAGALAGVVATMVAVNYGLPFAPMYGFALAVAAGIGKEVFDRFMPGQTVDVMDAVYTAGGGLLGASAVWTAMVR